MSCLVVTGTDTGIGKTVFSAGMAGILDGVYWKPVQAGLEGDSDSAVAARLGGLSGARIIPEAYRLSQPLSPHRAAELDGVSIDPDRLSLPRSDRPVVIEGAGGLMVPLTRTCLFIDIFARWHAPVVLCARTALGTINHTLLSIEALRSRSIPLLGIAFIGDAMPDTERSISEIGKARVLGRLPPLEPLTLDTLRAAMLAGFDLAAFDKVFR
jgi:dethiobiotin synthetase